VYGRSTAAPQLGNPFASKPIRVFFAPQTYLENKLGRQTSAARFNLPDKYLPYGNNPYTSISPNVVPPPIESSLPRVPMYTFPFATVGTVNFTAFPA
jgi:hypothetical protein